MKTAQELFDELLLAIQDVEYEQIKEILIALSHTYVYEWFFVNIFIEQSDEILLETLNKIEIDPNFERVLTEASLLVNAVYRGSLTLVDKLILLGGNVNLVDSHGCYPLSKAATGGYEDLYEYLFPLTEPQLQKPETDVFKKQLINRKQNHCICYSKIVFHMACTVISSKRKINLLTRIQKSSSTEKEAALWIAVSTGDELLTDLLISEKVNINNRIDYKAFVNPFDFKLLELDYLSRFDALFKSPFECLSIYSDKKENHNLDKIVFNPWKSKYQSLTLLMVAICFGAVSKYEELFTEHNYLKVIYLLIKAGSNINLQDYDGYTALHWAILLRWRKVVEVLIEAGANINIIDSFDYTPLMLSTYLEHSSIIKVITRAGASSSNLRQVKLIKAVEAENEEKLKFFLAINTNPNSSCPQGNSALKIAITKGNINICRILIQAGADTEYIDVEHKESALIRAVRQGNKDIIQLLIDEKAALNVQGAYWGETALIEAVRYCDLESLKLLVDAGADVNIRDNFGRTALDYADMKCLLCSFDTSTEMGIILLEAGAIF